MEVPFENKIIVSRKLYYEYSKKGFKVSKLISLIAGIVFFCAGVAAIPFFEIPYHDVAVSIILFVGSIFMLAWAFWGYIIFSAIAYKQQLLLYNGKEPENLTQFSDKIQIYHSSIGQSTLEYTQIEKIWETKEVIVLQIGKMMAIPLKKDGFTIGTYEEFKKYIKEKCINARIQFK